MLICILAGISGKPAKVEYLMRVLDVSRNTILGDRELKVIATEGGWAQNRTRAVTAWTATRLW